MTRQNVCYRKVFSDLMLLSKDSKEYNVKKKKWMEYSDLNGKKYHAET